MADTQPLDEDAVHGKCAHWLRGFIFKHNRDPYPQEVWEAAKKACKPVAPFVDHWACIECSAVRVKDLNGAWHVMEQHDFQEMSKRN